MKKSITNKIMLFFLGIIFFAIYSIVTYSNSVLKNNNEFIIDKEIKEKSKSIDLYLKEYFEFNRLNLNNISFRAASSNISKDLSYRLESMVYIYDSEGKLVYPRTKNSQKLEKTQDLDEAIDQKVSYTIKHSNSKTNVYSSYPILHDDKLIGIIRYKSDYTYLYNQSKSFIEKIAYFSIGVFFISILIAYIISKKITKPIITLANKTKEIASGNFDIDIDINSDDELGRLSLDFETMAKKIKHQIKIIEKDRDDLIELSKKQKRFFDNVTHELKTPMTTIIGYSEVLKDNQFTDEKFFNKGIDRIISEANRLNRMIVQLIEISRNSKKDFDYELKKINVSKIIISICEDMIHKSQKYNMKIDVDVKENLKIIGNEDKIKEILINLLDNAIKYGKINTTIYVKAEVNDGYINIKVVDSGEGICESELENILSPFYRVSKSDTREIGSTGLGLAIVKSIVESYNGIIEIQSEVNKGTMVLVKLPAIS